MSLALDLARRAQQLGEVPVGAVVLDQGRFVVGEHNRRETLADPTAHAEMLALRAAAACLGGWRLTSATLYCTLEPCPMCAGALVAARVERVVFATSDPLAGSAGSLYNICQDPRLNHEMVVEGGLLADEAAELLSEFFLSRRTR